MTTSHAGTHKPNLYVHIAINFGCSKKCVTPGRNMNYASRLSINPLLCCATFALAILAGWARKHVDQDARMCKFAFSTLLLHGIFGFFLFTKPNKDTLWRRTYWQKIYNVQLILLPMVVMLDAWYSVNMLRLKVFYSSVAVLIIALLVQLLSNVWRRALAMNIAVIWSMSLLAYLVHQADAYCCWTPGLMLLVLLNHFVLRRVATRYSLPELEFSSVSLCFYAIFALNSINELGAKIRF